MKIAIVGRETLLSRAEIESVSSSFEHISADASLFDKDKLDIDRLGGVIKIAAIISSFQFEGRNKLNELLGKLISRQFKNSSGKINFGFSFYQEKQIFSKKQIIDLAFSCKKKLIKKGFSTRYVKAKDGFNLSASQVKYNQLLKKGLDLIVVIAKKQVIIG